jgi:acetoin:2,6-dichlorophenolindophenol oxidoreductase subunit alpha
MAFQRMQDEKALSLTELYRQMMLVRKSEERLVTLFSDGEVPGFLHLSLGQEAVPVGVCAALEKQDTIASTHRGHGHALAMGIDLARFFAELMGREEGLCKGRGGSIHVADIHMGMLGANGIVGGSLAIALGSALAQQVRGTGKIAVAFFGDGAMAEGALHECLNLASLWKLPLLFVCENNGWSEFSPLEKQFVAQLGALAAAFKIPAEKVDGSDVERVRQAVSAMTPRIRAGEGPGVLECLTQRWRGHFEGDPQKYRAPADLSEARAIDPLEIAAAKLRERGVSDEQLTAVRSAVEESIEQAVDRARRGSEPDFASAAGDIYA